MVLLAVIAGFLAALTACEVAIRPAGMAARQAVTFLPVTQAGLIDRTAPVQQAPYSQEPVYRASADVAGPHVAFQIPFYLATPKEELAFFIGATPGLQEIRLNDRVLQPNVPRDTLRGATDGRAFFYMLPPALLQPGANHIEVLVETQSGLLALAPFHIGPATEAARAAEMAALISTYVPVMAISFLVFATLLCLVTNWPPQDRQRIRSLMLLLAIWALRTWFISFPTPVELPFLVTSFIYYALEVSLIFALARNLLAGEAALEDWRKGLGWLWLAIICYLVAVTLAGFVVGPAVREWFKALAWANSLLLAVLAVIGLSLLAWGVATRRDGRWLERLALMVCLLALSIDALDSILAVSIPLGKGVPLTFYAAAPVGLLLGLGVIASIAREASEARRTVVQSNQILAGRLAEQDAELARSYDAQKQMLQRHTMLEERQRIVRDMHDGIGGQLLGLLMQVRSGGADAPVVEQGLQASIADLRLIVDSMDSAEGGLAETLRSFEHRARPQVEAAGMAFSVEHGLPDDQPGPGPRPALQILRVLQEALTNALRHSGGTRISLASAVAPEGAVTITLADNGRGLPAEVKGGRGLASMQNRAAAVGGTLAIASSDGGTVLSLTIPDPATSPPA
ncbi:sensor histidine kinase [Alteraurantiacibacter buctensis]|uniref:sensor histidine kinase n=1 Tax=Alteraurantiacibacter buctensis TaxID=1503981 RepID=UPI00301BBCD5